MAVTQQCPMCKRRQSIRRKVCLVCGEDMDRAKRSGRVTYWVEYRLPGGQKQREKVGTSFEDAKDIDVDRKYQKGHGGLPYKSRVTFNELKDWYLSRERVKALAAFRQITVHMNRFCSVYGDNQVNQLRAVDLEDLQMKRKAAGLADATIDDEIGYIRTMVTRAFDNDMIGGEPLKAFRRTPRLLKRNSNARDRVLSPEEYQRLYEAAHAHLKPIIGAAYYTGMRRGEILGLTWDKVDLRAGIIHLRPEDTKDREARDIPICDELKEILTRVPRALHIQSVFLFTQKMRDGSVTQRPVKDIQRGMKDACKDAGITWGKTRDGFIFHDLRHTFVTNMRKAGVSESVIMSITGHSTRQMFDRYNRIDAIDRSEGMEKLRYFLGAAHLTAQYKKNTESLSG
jgi:integrase